MTLKEFVESEAAKMFLGSTKIYFEKHDGCYFYTCTFDGKVNLGNALRSLNESVLSQEISMIVTGIHFLRFSFKD